MLAEKQHKILYSFYVLSNRHTYCFIPLKSNLNFASDGRKVFFLEHWNTCLFSLQQQGPKCSTDPEHFGTLRTPLPSLSAPTVLKCSDGLEHCNPFRRKGNQRSVPVFPYTPPYICVCMYYSKNRASLTYSKDSEKNTTIFKSTILSNFAGCEFSGKSIFFIVSVLLRRREAVTNACLFVPRRRAR